MATSHPSRFDGVAQSIQETLVRDCLPSLVVAVAQHGEILWEEGFGWANREAMIPATPHSMYSLASISKPITATALMLLQQRGLIDLDRPINDYLGDAPVKARVGNAADATVRRVANHTSGLPLHYHFFYEDEPYRRPPMEETIRRYGNLVTAPGERYQYSNLGYGILDHVISRLSGKSYPDFLREEVFLPLGMTHSSVGLGHGLEGYEARRYGEDGIAYPGYDFDHPGGSAVYASADDLLRFGMFHLKAHLTDQKQILYDETVDAMQVPTASNGEESYGIGWGIAAGDFGYRTVAHTGGMGGVRTVLFLAPSEEIAVVVLCNSSKDSDAVFRTNREILSVLVPPLGQGLTKRAQEREAAAKEPSQAPFAPPADLMGTWKGEVHTYLRDLPFTLMFKDSGDVHATLGDDLTMLVNDVSLNDGRLTGVMPGDIGTPDASRRRHNLHLDLQLRGDALTGALVAITSDGQDGGAPGHHLGNALASWASLRR